MQFTCSFPCCQGHAWVLPPSPQELIYQYYSLPQIMNSWNRVSQKSIEVAIWNEWYCRINQLEVYLLLAWIIALSVGPWSIHIFFSTVHDTGADIKIESLNNSDNAPLDLLKFCVVWWDSQNLCQMLSEFCLSFLKFPAN